MLRHTLLFAACLCAIAPPAFAQAPSMESRIAAQNALFEMLSAGVLPLDLLDQRTDRWIAAQKQGGGERGEGRENK